MIGILAGSLWWHAKELAIEFGSQGRLGRVPMLVVSDRTFNMEEAVVQKRNRQKVKLPVVPVDHLHIMNSETMANEAKVRLNNLLNGVHDDAEHLRSAARGFMRVRCDA